LGDLLFSTDNPFHIFMVLILPRRYNFYVSWQNFSLKICYPFFHPLGEMAAVPVQAEKQAFGQMVR